jgi:hypothetical protein
MKKQALMISLALVLSIAVVVPVAAPVRADPALTLAARWDFNEEDGQVASDLTGRNDGRLGSTNDPDIYDPSWAPSMDSDYGNALLFDGTNDYVKVEDSNSLDITGHITLEAWIKPMAEQLPSETMILSKWGLQDNQRSYTIYIRGYSSRGEVQTLRFLLSPNGFCCGGVRSDVDMNQYNGSWVHVAGTYDGTTQRSYIEGVEQGTMTVSKPVFAGTAPLYIGIFTQGDRPFNGYIDEVRVWGSALDASQLDDMTGPVVSNVVANPVAINTVPTVTFDVSDGTGTGVDSVEYRVDGADPWIPALPSFDEPGLHSIEVRGTDYALNKGEAASTLLEVYYPFVEMTQAAIDEIQSIIDEDPGSDVADKLEDARDKAQIVLEELSKNPPDNQAAVGNLEGAVGELEAAVEDGYLDAETGIALMERLVGVARQLAVDALNYAVDYGGDQGEIDEAFDYLDEGDDLRASGKYKDAVNKYKDALSKAEGAI